MQHRSKPAPWQAQDQLHPTRRLWRQCGHINAEKIQLTGNKWDQKEYVRFTGYPGGQRFRTAKEQHERNPISLVEKGVKGMLPKNRLGRALFRNMHVYAGAEHNQAAQQPQEFKINA